MTWLLLLLLAASSPDATARAERLTQRCITEYNGGAFDEALTDGQRAYAIRPVAGLLFNLGQIHRALHHWEEAAFSYRAYLRELPTAANRVEVEAMIAAMDTKLRAATEDRSRPTNVLPPRIDAALVPAAPPVAQPAKPHLPRIAVLDMQAHGGVSADFVQGITSVVVHDVRERAADTAVVGSDDIRALVGLEHQKQLLGCTNVSCLAEIGGALGAERLVLGSLARFGETYVLDLRLIDSRNAHVLSQGSARFRADDAVPDAVARSVAGLFPMSAAANGSARPELTEEIAPRRSRPLAWTLWTSGAVAAGFAIYGLGRVAQTQNAINAIANDPHNLQVYNANIATAAAAVNAQHWQVATIALGIAAAAAGVGGGFAW